MYSHLVCVEEVTKVGGVCKADTGSCDKVVLHFNNNRLFALKVEIVCDLAACKTAADNYYLVANGLVAEKVIYRLNRLFYTGNRNSLCLSTGSNNNFISLDSRNILDLGIKLNLDRKLLYLSDIPCDKLAVLLLEGGSSSCYEYTAKLVGLFVNGNLVSALCKENCSLHTADTATDYGNALSLLCGLHVVLLGLHGLGIKRTACKTHSVGKVLGVVVTLGGGEVKAACMTADTGTNVLESVLNKLGNPLSVCKELSCNTNTVDSAFSNSLSTNVRLHTACTYYGDVNELLDVSNVVKVTVLGHVHRGMCPVPGVICTVVCVKHIVTCVLKILCSSLGLFHVTTNLDVLLTGNSTLAEALHLGLYRVTERNGEVLATLGLDCLNNLCCKAVSVLKAAAVFVGTLVEELDRKLVKKITLVYCVNLNTVNTCVAAELCSLCKCLDDLVDLVLGHFGTDDVGCPTSRLLGGRCKLVACIKNGLKNCSCKLVLVKRAYKLGDCPGASHTCGKLNEELCAGLMDLVHKFLKLLEHLGILPEPLAPEGISKGSDTGDDKTYVIVCSLKEKLCSLLVKATAGQLKPTKQRRTAHRTHNDTVFDLYVAYFPRGKQGFVLRIYVCHSKNPFFLFYFT